MRIVAITLLRLKRSLEQVKVSGVAVRRQDKLDGQREERREPGAVVGARLSFGKPVVGDRSAGERVAEYQCAVLSEPQDALVWVEAGPRFDRDLGYPELVCALLACHGT
jgi:hypothetical protein